MKRFINFFFVLIQINFAAKVTILVTIFKYFQKNFFLKKNYLFLHFQITGDFFVEREAENILE